MKKIKEHFILRRKWTQDEDLTLVDLILRYIRENLKIEDAIEHAAQELKRDPMDCYHRWFVDLSKQYEHAIQQAYVIRDKRLANIKHRLSVESEKPVEKPLKLQDVIEFLQTLDTEDYKEKYEELLKEHETLLQDYRELYENYTKISEFIQQASALAQARSKGLEVQVDKQGWVAKVKQKSV